MARRHLLVPFAALVAACTPRALTPNARGFAFDAPTTPEVGHSDAQFDITRIGMPFGAEAVNGGARYRRTLRPGLVAEGEGGLLHLTNEGSGGSRNAVTGRVGLMLRPPSEQELRTALTLGVGGGLSSTAGDWVSVDVGAAVGGSHPWLRPFVGGDVSYNAAVGSKPFTVDDSGGAPVTLQLPDTIGLRTTAGLELGPPDRALVIGFSLARMIAREPDVLSPPPTTGDVLNDDVAVAIGLGFRVAVE